MVTPSGKDCADAVAINSSNRLDIIVVVMLFESFQSPLGADFGVSKPILGLKIRKQNVAGNLVDDKADWRSSVSVN